MCDFTNEPGGREAHMTVLQRDENGTPTIWCDPCITPFVWALNEGGIPTVASCCGHGKNDPSIALADGRWLTITTEAPTSYEHRTPQGEPTDAQVKSALAALSRFNGWNDNPHGAMRAALRAAFTAGHEDKP